MTGKIRIAFVDDEPNILRGLRRSLAAMSSQWDMQFLNSGEEALREMAAQPFDVVVTDMRMPGMDGAQLLDAVRASHPGTIRVILSGFADNEAILRTVGPAHVYLAKPCSAEVLRDTVARLVRRRGLLDNDGLRRALAGLSNLPSLPQIYLDLQRELKSPHCSAQSVADLIATDLAMTAKLLQLTNSAFFAVSSRVTSPLAAVRLLGLDVLQTLVLRLGLFRQFRGSPSTAPLLEALTSHGLAVARLAERLAVTEADAANTGKAVRIAAMLADLGSVILLDAHPRTFVDLLHHVSPDKSLRRSEEQAFGAGSAAIAAYLLGLWGFSDEIVEAVAYADRPSRLPGCGGPVLAVLHAATALGPPSPLGQSESLLDLDYLERCGLADRLPRWQQIAAAQAAAR